MVLLTYSNSAIKDSSVLKKHSYPCDAHLGEDKWEHRDFSDDFIVRNDHIDPYFSVQKWSNLSGIL